MQAPLQARNDSDAALTDTARTVAQEQVLADNRPVVAAQGKLAEMMNNSPRVLQQQALSDAIHNSPRMVAQRHQMNVFFGEEVKPQGDGAMPAEASLAQREEKTNKPGLPNQLKSGIESLSGMSMDHVTVHYNSDKPVQLQAHAYAQGSEIHVAPGQEQHLPHEAWHVVQQAQRRVRPTMQIEGGVTVNDDVGLEREADFMGARAASIGRGAAEDKGQNLPPASTFGQVLQRQELSTTERVRRTPLKLSVPHFGGIPLGRPVQLLRHTSTNLPVDVTSLTTEYLSILAVNLGGGTPIATPGYTYDHIMNDFGQVSAELRRRKPAPPMEIDDDLDQIESEASESEDAGASDSNFVLDPGEDMIARLTSVARKDAGLDTIRDDAPGQERELRNWPERSLVGTMGELQAQDSMRNAGRSVLPLNSLRLNFSGLDHLSNDPTHPFEQTKLHISDSTANVDTYRAHANNAGLYAIKAVRALKNNQAALQQRMQDLNDARPRPHTRAHPSAEEEEQKEVFPQTDKVRKVIEALDDLDGTGDDDIEGTVAHDLLTAGMAFSVPKDIYERIPPAQRGPFRALEWTVAQFNATKDAMADDYDKAKAPGSKPKPEDEEYTGK